jgi:ribokinase
VRLAVVGHVEWVHFVRVERIPTAGEIVHAVESWEEPAGGGPGAAVQLQKLGGACHLYTALGRDELGSRAFEELRSRGLAVHKVFRTDAQRRAVTFVDGDGERTITVIGKRLQARGRDRLPWDRLEATDGVYFTAGDEETLRASRQARVLVCTTRILDLLQRAGLQLDAVVGSDDDESERYQTGDLEPVPHLAVLTKGERGGRFSVEGGAWEPFEAPKLPGAIVDTYGAGDSFAAGLTFGLASGLGPREAIGVGARCGAAVLTGRGPYEAQLTSDELGLVH